MHSSCHSQIATLRETGYVLVPGLLSGTDLEALNHVARAQLAGRAEPLEFEADLQYPGAPSSRTAEGGQTVRRLLDAYGRDPCFAEHGTSTILRQWLETYFGENVLLSRAHHNCLMTKHPRYGSLTGWHRDIRYWSFKVEDLVSVWFALGEERMDNGALWFVPGSHRQAFSADRFDADKFFRADDADNAELLKSSESPQLAPGDAVFFHCNTLHSAGPNRSEAVKFSLVYTYHGVGNEPTPGTRSAAKPEVPLRLRR
jgi:phytanoyl-CoA hydroxylase